LEGAYAAFEKGIIFLVQLVSLGFDGILPNSKYESLPIDFEEQMSLEDSNTLISWREITHYIIVSKCNYLGNRKYQP